MAKRLTGTNKWDKAWFRKLSPRHKILWQFLCDKCDQAGMWEIDLDSATHFINDEDPITENDLKVFGERVERYSKEKLWIVDFVEFQCGELSEKSPAHKPIFKLLKKYTLLDRVLNRVSNTLQEKEIEIEKEKEEEKEIERPAKNKKVNTHGKGKVSVSVRAIYATEKPDVIFELDKYFASKDQLTNLTESGFTRFEDFIKSNAGNVFNDYNHLYSTFRKFCIEGAPVKIVPPAGREDPYSEAVYNLGIFTLEAWKNQYKHKIKTDPGFRERFKEQLK
jgi:hypothetical protein